MPAYSCSSPGHTVTHPGDSDGNICLLALGCVPRPDGLSCHRHRSWRREVGEKMATIDRCGSCHVQSSKTAIDGWTACRRAMKAKKASLCMTEVTGLNSPSASAVRTRTVERRNAAVHLSSACRRRNLSLEWQSWRDPPDRCVVGDHLTDPSPSERGVPSVRRAKRSGDAVPARSGSVMRQDVSFGGL